MVRFHLPIPGCHSFLLPNVNAEQQQNVEEDYGGLPMAKEDGGNGNPVNYSTDQNRSKMQEYDGLPSVSRSNYR
jgi:hypothetical protein